MISRLPPHCHTRNEISKNTHRHTRRRKKLIKTGKVITSQEKVVKLIHICISWMFGVCWHCLICSPALSAFEWAFFKWAQQCLNCQSSSDSLDRLERSLNHSVSCLFLPISQVHSDKSKRETQLLLYHCTVCKWALLCTLCTDSKHYYTATVIS